MAENYHKGQRLGGGTWGDVYEAQNKIDGKVYAIKRIKKIDADQGLNFTALREIKILKELKHDNIIKIFDVFITDENALNLVLEYCEYDLAKIIKDKNIFIHPIHVKCYMEMILRSIDHCHQNFILHRDLSPANFLINSKGEIKLADFGLARPFASPNPMTFEVVTLWYRAPELLFKSRMYGVGVDLWSIGCIFAELILRAPLFPGENECDQLAKIFNILGTPNETNWPGSQLLPNFIEFEFREPLDITSLFPNFNREDSNYSLLVKFLTLNPIDRIRANKALEHPYFTSEPLACPPGDLPLPTMTKENPNKRSRFSY